MSRTTLIIRNDIKRRLKAPMATILFLVIPLAMTAVIGMIFDPGAGNETKLPPIKLLVVDNDKDLAAKFLLGAFDQKEIKDMFQVTLTDAASGEALMKKGKASAMLVIPEHFSDDLADQKPTALEVVKNPSEEFLPGVAEEFAATMAVGFSGLAQVFADELKVIKSVRNLSLESVTIADMTPFLEMARAKIIALNTYLSPMLLTVKSSTTTKPGQEARPAGFNIFSYIFPGMLIMFLLFIIEPSLREIQNERADGKIRRMMFSPLSGRELVTARIFSGWLLGMLVCAAGHGRGHAALRHRLGEPPAAAGPGRRHLPLLRRPVRHAQRFFQEQEPGRGLRQPHHPGVLRVRRQHAAPGAAAGGHALGGPVHHQQLVHHGLPGDHGRPPAPRPAHGAGDGGPAFRRHRHGRPAAAAERLIEETNMKKIWHIGRLDLKLMVKDKAFFFWVLLFPLVFILIFGNLYQGSKTDTKASLTVLNQDQGRWGAYFIEKLKSPGIELTVVASRPG